MASRVERYFQDLDSDRLTEVQRAMTRMVQDRVEALVKSSLAPLTSSTTALRALANQLEDLEDRASRAVLQAADEDSNNSAPDGAPS